MAGGPRTGASGAPSTLDGDPGQVGGVVEQLGRLARSLEASVDTGAMLDEIVAAAVQLVPGAEDASVSLVVARRRVTSRHGTSDLPGRGDAIQTDTGGGPCLDAAYEQETVRVPDLRHEQVGLLFARQAAEAFVDAEQLGHLHRVVVGRDLIGQAMGMLMERYGVDDGGAFRVLSRVSQASDQTLRAVAEELVTTRRLELLEDP